MAGQERSSAEWIKANIKKRECNTFIPQTGLDLEGDNQRCCCGREKVKHASIANTNTVVSNIVWDKGEHTTLLPTDSYGGVHMSPAATATKFVRAASDTEPALLYELLTVAWRLAPPNLLISFIGHDATLSSKMRTALCLVANSTGAWLLTRGLASDLVCSVGRVARECKLASFAGCQKVVAIGIAPWGMVQGRDVFSKKQSAWPSLLVDKTHTTLPLDVNHTHFLLMDDGTESSAGVECNVRATLENFISQQKTMHGGSGCIEIPVVYLITDGKPEDIKMVRKAVESGTPCLLLAGSGGLADCLASLLKVDPSLLNEALLSQKLEDVFGERIRSCSRDELQELVQSMLDIMKHPELLTSMKQEESETLDLIILKALLRVSRENKSGDGQTYLDELKLAVAWDRLDIAQTELLNGSVKWKAENLEEVLQTALVNNKPGFVAQFLENGVNVATFTTRKRLEGLYRATATREPLRHLLLGKTDKRLHSDAEKEFVGHQQLSLDDVRSLLNDFLGNVCNKLYSIRKDVMPMDDPWGDLFIWAILHNRLEMAKYFWKKNSYPVSTALAGACILKRLAEVDGDTRQEHKDSENELNEMALALLDEAYNNNETETRTLLIHQTRKWGNATCLQLATEAGNQRLFAHRAVQDLLNRMWWGSILDDTEIWKLLLCCCFPPLLAVNLVQFHSGSTIAEKSLADQKDVTSVNRMPLLEDGQSGTQTPRPSAHQGLFKKCIGRWLEYCRAPVIVFLHNIIAYLLFLILFAYVLLEDFSKGGPNYLEFVLYFIVFTLICEEVRQSIAIASSTSLLLSLHIYSEGFWNKIDIIAFTLFIFGFIFRLFESTFDDGRILMSIDFLVYTMRLIHMFTIHKELGPQINIVGGMMKDLFFFLFILIVWIFAYGVATEGILHPGKNNFVGTIRRVFFRPYLQIFGRIPLDEIDAQNWNYTATITECLDKHPSACPNAHGNWLVLLLLIIFLIVTNILLLNLLIAMFSHTFARGQSNSDAIWKYQRFHLIEEYCKRPSIPPPFIILSHLNELFHNFGCKRPHTRRARFVLELQAEEGKKLMEWERVQLISHLAKVAQRVESSNEVQLRCTSKRMGELLRLMNNIQSHEDRVLRLETQLKYCADALAWIVKGLQDHSVSLPPPTSPGRDA
uniref:transient receptor potential cation channel subfamily M member 4-like isoform X2 n=1 Tax=Myxine glutinosa TaxID=7769 RepID=UPI00358F0465